MNWLNRRSLFEVTLKILLTSGFAERAESHDESIQLHTDMLNKPYRQAELIKQIRFTLDEIKTS